MSDDPKDTNESTEAPVSLPDGIPEDLSPGHLDEIATALLGRSYAYFDEFVPAQLIALEDHIATVHERLGKGRDAGDIQRLTGALRSLHQSHTEMIERSTIIFMASYKPLVGLVESMRKPTKLASSSTPSSNSGGSNENVTPDDQKALEAATDLEDPAVVDETAQTDEWSLSEDQISDLYRPYEDQEPEEEEEEEEEET